MEQDISRGVSFRRLPWVLSSPEVSNEPGGYLGPNWFASVMGTGIVANASATLPMLGADLHVFALVAWVLAALLLLGLIVAVATHWVRHTAVARSYARDPSMSQFYGAPPMALMTVGAGGLLVGKSLIGNQAALNLDWVLWTAGTMGGLFTAVWIPYLQFTAHEVRADAAFGGWLMPIVPPMVSAATGALLIPHLAAGSGRTTLLYACYAMFGLSLVASLVIITMIWSRLVHHGTSGTARVPTLWIVLGPLGQSITAAGLLGTTAGLAVSPQLATSMNAFAVLYGVPIWGFALLWIGLAAALTLRTLQRRLPFALTWWSFTFPVGTYVTGTTQLALHTGLPAFRWAAVSAFLALITAWIVVGVRTAHNTLHGDLLKHPAASGPVVAHKG